MQTDNSHFDTQTHQRENSSQTVTTSSLFLVYDFFKPITLEWVHRLILCYCGLLCLTVSIDHPPNFLYTSTSIYDYAHHVIDRPGRKIDNIEINLLMEIKVISLQFPPLILELLQPPQNNIPLVQNILSEWGPLFGNTSEQWLFHWFYFIFIESTFSTNIP